MLTVLTGGARSGKSTAALRLASTEAEVVYIATAEAGDAEMRERIDRHRLERPDGWQTVEEPREVGAAVVALADGVTVIIDCLALWVTNLLDRPDEEIIASGEALASMLAARRGSTIVVTNEVGSGIVPDNALARRFRDVLGAVNRVIVDSSDDAFLCVAGGVVRIHPLTAAGPALA